MRHVMFGAVVCVDVDWGRRVVRPSLRVLLAVEVLVCFGPMTVMLLLGALLIPIQIAALLHEPLLWDGPVQVIGSVLCGCIGLVSLIVLLRTLFGDSRPIRRPALVLVGAAIGAIPLLDVVTSPIVVWRVVGAMPLLSAAHIIFMSRRMLFGHV
jgi:hypothetical protein